MLSSLTVLIHAVDILNIDGCVANKRADYQIGSVLYCVLPSCAVEQFLPVTLGCLSRFCILSAFNWGQFVCVRVSIRVFWYVGYFLCDNVFPVILSSVV